MSQLIKAHVTKSEFYGQPRTDINVELALAPDDAFKFNVRATIYRAQVRDEVRFYAYDKPGNGFGGHRYTIQMAGGGYQTLIGPWSSRSGVVNSIFNDMEPCVECVDQHRVVRHITMKALLVAGVSLVPKIEPSGEIYYRPPEQQTA